MKHIIRSLCILILLSLTLTGCKYNDDNIDNNDKNNGQEEKCPYGNYDYSLKPYFSYYSGLGSPMVYQNFAFYIDKDSVIVYTDLSNLQREMREYSKKRTQDEIRYNGKLGQPKHPVCNEEHTNMRDCPAYVNGIIALDAYESGGSYPVFYQATLDANSVGSSNYCLYRYSGSSNTKEKVSGLKGKPNFFMTYGDYVFVSETYGKDQWIIESVNKKTGKTVELDFGDKRIQPMHADGDKFYFFEWLSGTVYVTDMELGEYKAIFTAPEIYEITPGDMNVGLFIHNGYIYFRADYEKKEVPTTSPEVNLYPLAYNIRRVPLDNPESESELVAKGVFEKCDLGIFGDYFYFTPFDYPYGKENEYYYNFNNGRLCRTNIKTLETEDVLTDSGLLFDGNDLNYVNDRCAILHMQLVDKNGTFMTEGDGRVHVTLLDFKTNEAYFVTEGMGNMYI